MAERSKKNGSSDGSARSGSAATRRSASDAPSTARARSAGARASRANAKSAASRGTLAASPHGATVMRAPETSAAPTRAGARAHTRDAATNGGRANGAGARALGAARAAWDERRRARAKDRPGLYTTISGAPVNVLYTPADLPDFDYERDLGWPGEYPYTRGVHYNMYRGKMWTQRLFSGFATALETNKRYHYLLEHGGTGLSVAFDMPTLMGYDSDHALAEGEVGICGVAIDSLADMKTLFDGIPLGQVSTSMTINGPAAILFAFYLGVAESQGVPFEKLRGTLQNDILKEYIAQKEWIFPPEPHMRLITDIIRFCVDHVPQWNPVSISGYHIREAGSTAAQELAFTLADGFAYVDAAIATGLGVDQFAPRLSFFFNAHLDFFEEIAKYRAARRIWARHMRERYGAKNERSWMLRFHTQTAGCSLTAQQPENNIIRTAFEALAGVLGGTQSLHTNAMDEAIALPSDKAALIALRTQQIIAHELEVTHTIDPLGGSYYVENLTNRLEQEAERIFEEIAALGGVIPAIEKGYFQREIARSAYRYQREIEEKQRIVVGINDYVLEGEGIDIPILRIDPEIERAQKRRVADVRATRDHDRTKRALEALRAAALGSENLMPHLLDATRAMATEGEIVETLKGVFSTYTEPAYF
jgi:methylmalonyl-CoA mutase N-terminal domain/subunit